jgi:hypothetical protein
VTVSFSKYIPWQAMYQQRSTHFSKTCCRPLITLKFLASELPFHGWKSPDIAWGRDLDCMADVLMGFLRTTFSKPNTKFKMLKSLYFKIEVIFVCKFLSCLEIYFQTFFSERGGGKKIMMTVMLKLNVNTQRNIQNTRSEFEFIISETRLLVSASLSYPCSQGVCTPVCVCVCVCVCLYVYMLKYLFCNTKFLKKYYGM